jgi:hypothetical protein
LLFCFVLFFFLIWTQNFCRHIMVWVFHCHYPCIVWVVVSVCRHNVFFTSEIWNTGPFYINQQSTLLNIYQNCRGHVSLVDHDYFVLLWFFLITKCISLFKLSFHKMILTLQEFTQTISIIFFKFDKEFHLSWNNLIWLKTAFWLADPPGEHFGYTCTW